MQVNDDAHFGISANLALVACAIVEPDILDFEDPIVAAVGVDCGEPWVTDVSVSARGEDLVFARPQPEDLVFAGGGSVG